MGQKANLLTLKKKSKLNLINLQYSNFLYANIFLIFLKKLFDKKKIFLINSSLNLLGSQFVLNLNLFFRTVKINKFKKKIKKSKKNKLNNTLLRKSIIAKIYSKTLIYFKTNLIILAVLNLNKYYNKIIFLKLFFKFKRFHTRIFPRRFNFFIDFLKLSVLFVNSKINLHFYTQIIGEIFKILPKRRHNFFFLFVEQYFKILLTEIKNLSFKGIKLMLSGRIQAKPRAKFKFFQLGKVPLQTFSVNTDFAKTHVYTVYGVFGLKIWIYKI